MSKIRVSSLAAGLGLAAAFCLAAAIPVKAEEVLVTQYKGDPTGAPFAIAIEKGFFKKAGIDITGHQRHRRRRLGAGGDGNRPRLRRGVAGRRDFGHQSGPGYQDRRHRLAPARPLPDRLAVIQDQVAQGLERKDLRHQQSEIADRTDRRSHCGEGRPQAGRHEARSRSAASAAPSRRWRKASRT